ncbi:hypothetical protein L208DRAFT_1380137 [Tricholoma matsutake]|nr:hypothetical protein L208DRAFT_1380137 [Tricholoma matsutake 945]
MAQTATPASRKPSAHTQTAPKKPNEVVPPPQKNSQKKKATQASPVDDDEDAVIKQGLFPASGTKSQLSNTAVKNDYLWMLCEAVFEEHPNYEKTGEGISSHNQIDMSLDNMFTNKWGLGNNDTPVDIFTILPGIDAETEEDVDKKDNGFDENIAEYAKKYTNDLDSQGSDVKDDSIEAQVPTKCKVGHPSQLPSNLKKKSLVDQFADTSKAEEETAQKRIELRKEKVVAEKDMKVVSIKAKAAIEMKKQELKAQYALEKMRLEHQYHLAELQVWNGMAAGSSDGPGVIVQPMAASGSSSKSQGSLGSNLGTPFTSMSLTFPK